VHLVGRVAQLDLHTVQPEDRPAAQVLDMRLSFDLARFGQLQGKLVLLRPGLLLPASRYSFSAEKRKLPVQILAERHVDRVTLSLPSTLAPDEIPDPVTISTRYGRYTASYTVKEGGLQLEQRLDVNDTLVPASEYAALRSFFEQISGFQNGVLVLARK